MSDTIDADHLKDRDLALFLSLHEGRFVTSDQAGRYIWGHINSSNRRLRPLELSGYIRRTQDRYLRQTIIRPRQAAIEALLQRGQITLQDHAGGWTWAQLFARTIGFVVHECQVNELRFRLLEACLDHDDIKVVTCFSGPRARQQFEINGRVCQLRPDRRIELKVPGTPLRQLFYIEADRGTRSLQTRRGWGVVRQLSFYQRYHQARPGLAFRVLMLCPSCRRVDNILEALDREPYRHRLGRLLRAYAVWDEFLDDPLGPVWIPESDPLERYSIVEEWPACPTF